MLNSTKPTLEELPTTSQLVKSTIIAFVAAVAVLVIIVMPAEYGIDPTGIGRSIGLTEMGEIKKQLSEEAEADRGPEQLDRADRRGHARRAGQASARSVLCGAERCWELGDGQSAGRRLPRARPCRPDCTP